MRLQNFPTTFTVRAFRLVPAALAALMIFDAGRARSAEAGSSATWISLGHDLKIADMGSGQLNVLTTPESALSLPKTEKNKLRVQLSWAYDEKNFDAFKRLTVRLHYADGRVSQPTFSVDAGLISIGGSIHASRLLYFPFGDNTLTEAWIELRSAKHTYWLEIPYGFTRDPDDPLPPSEPSARHPQFAPAMSKMSEADDIVRWSDILYQFDSVQNDWRLEVSLVNRGPIRCVVNLRRKEGQWSIHSPITTVKVESDDGQTITNDQISSRLKQPNDREDEFEFNFKPLKGRGWAKLTVSVDDTVQSQIISLGSFLPGIWIPPSKQ